MSERQQVTIKAKCKGVIRLLKIPKESSYEEFYHLLKNSFGISHCQVQYSDEEGDLVELGSKEELQEALRVGEKFGPLKITIVTEESPTMSAMTNVPKSDSPVKPSDNTDSAAGNPTALVEPLSGMTLGDKPTPKPRPNRKRAGFYTSLCSDISDIQLERSLMTPGQGNQGNAGLRNRQEQKKHRKRNAHQERRNNASSACEIPESGNASANKVEPRKTKKEKKLQGSKYYTSLAEDIAAMKLAQLDQTCQPNQSLQADQGGDQSSLKDQSNQQADQTCPDVERKQSQVPATKVETTHSPISRQQDVDAEVEQVEKELNEVTLSDDEPPPKWFGKIVRQMSQSVSSQVLGALNGALISSIPAEKPVRRDGAHYVHEGIACNGCKQIIIGPRYKCGNCPDYDLCEECEVIDGLHDPSHVFVKLRFPCIGIGRRHGVMIPLLKNIIYKSKDVELAEEQDKRMKEVRKKLKQLAKRKREEQVGKKKADKKIKKLKAGIIYSNTESPVSGGMDLACLGDESYPDGTEVTPGFEFTKCWKIRNTGNIAWNRNTKLAFMYGQMRCQKSNEVDLPHLEPGQEGMAMVTFIAPLDEGEYYSVWRGSHDGRIFGKKIWCKVKVIKEEVPSAEEDEMVDKDACGTPTQESETPGEPNLEILNNHGSSTIMTEPDPIFHSYTVQTQNNEIDTNESENQATTSNASLLECNDLEWDTCLLDDDHPIIVNEDDAQDIEVISNASSDDYCVVPLPACFNPDIPLNSGDFAAVESPEMMMEPEVLLEPLVDEQKQANEENSEDDEPGTDEEDETTTPEDNAGSTEEDIKVIPIIPEEQSSSHEVVVESRSASQTPESTQSTPIDIVVQNSERNNFSPVMPSFDVRSTISEPVATQPHSFERTPMIPGRLPSSPPGRAVPVVQTQSSAEIPLTRVCSVPGSFEVHAASGVIEDSEWKAVRTQPPEVVVARQVSEEETVTIQPRGASPTTSPNSNQSTAQFASSLVTGTLKRAIGTVADTVTSFVTGKDSNPTVAYDAEASGDDAQIHVILPEVVVPVETRERSTSGQNDTRAQHMKLQEMGFCDRLLNERLLKKYNNDVNKVVTELLHENDNNWHNGRH
ncbi:next to BRCA1 gene 1 protein-like [Dendronephthya gigantea]|uniref:next to BRCA1 gene 1 protein-like n=1 Tax=Dendronephthya gigantea TaxID=151771 RepID=UPI001069FB1C|nr:next to BRCA1 gene 1 protein-like [Dendronephthya gigantea]